jgi:hypothetical protein
MCFRYVHYPPALAMSIALLLLLCPLPSCSCYVHCPPASATGHWKQYIVALDSQGERGVGKGSVVLVHQTTKKVTPLWTCDEPCFLKGLAVVGDKAIFGKSPPQKRLNRYCVGSV